MVGHPHAGTTLGDGFDRRVFVDVIALVAALGFPTLLILAAVFDRPYILIGLALVIPALAAIPVALERRHLARPRQRDTRADSGSARDDISP